MALGYAQPISAISFISEGQLNYLITTFLPLYIYRPFCVGFALSLRPCISYHAAAAFSVISVISV